MSQNTDVLQNNQYNEEQVPAEIPTQSNISDANPQNSQTNIPHSQRQVENQQKTLEIPDGQIQKQVENNQQTQDINNQKLQTQENAQKDIEKNNDVNQAKNIQPVQNQDVPKEYDNQLKSQSNLKQQRQSERSIRDSQSQTNNNIPQQNIESQHNLPSRASKKSQSSQSRPESGLHNMKSNQQVQDQEEASEQMKPRNFDQIESVIVQKNQSGEIIKKAVQVIKIIRSSKQKPFLGGFKHSITEITYHNAFSQTDQNRTEHKLQFTREVQTYDYSSKSSKVPRQFGTQMEKQGVYVDIRTDKVMYPRIYFDSDMWQQRRIQAALYIQRLTRGMFARKQTNTLKQQKLTKQLGRLNKQEEVRKKQQIKHKKQIERRRNPRTKEDFEILYEELENWRAAQVQKIKNNKSLTSDQRRKALKETLDKETDLLQTIDRLKIIAAKDNKELKIDKFLKSMSDPKKWTRKSDGRVTEVHTPFTVRAKELMDLYKGLRMKNVSTDQRLDILLATKWTVKEWDCNLTRQIVELIDREGSILDRGRSENSLQGLRQRLANLFLQFIEYPLFNPQAARFQKIPYQIAEVGEQLH